MKRLITLSAACFFSLNLAAQKPAKKTAPIFKNLLDSFSYAAGYNVAVNMQEQNITNLNTALMKKAMEDALANKPSLLTPAQMSTSLQMQLEAFRKQKLDKEKAKGAAFLAENKKRKGVVVLPNGLQYQIVKSGEATAPTPGTSDSVVVNYIGTYVDGVEFESSYKKGSPALFKITGVINGWTEILQLMHVGDKWNVYIPSDLAYGDLGRDGKFAGSTLVFEITLEEVRPFVAKQ